jgi:hypothetical protein
MFQDEWKFAYFYLNSTKIFMKSYQWNDQNFKEIIKKNDKYEKLFDKWWFSFHFYAEKLDISIEKYFSCKLFDFFNIFDKSSRNSLEN